jgi:glycerol-3-phosphate dehydrogenase
VVDKKFFSGSHALMIPKTKDGRVLFALPWHNKVVIGTTDTVIKEISYEPKALEEEVSFIIEHFNLYNHIAITKKDVLSVFAGLRPLIKKNEAQKTASVSRDHHIFISKSQMITITGGKWTTYRKMGEEVIDKAFAFLQIPFKKSGTKNLQLADYTTDITIPANLKCYGKFAKDIEHLMERDALLKEKLHPEFTYTLAELVWAMENEMACTVEDILARRSRILFLHAEAALEIAPKTSAFMAKYLHKDDRWIKDQIEAFTLVARNYILNDD